MCSTVYEAVHVFLAISLMPCSHIALCRKYGVLSTVHNNLLSAIMLKRAWCVPDLNPFWSVRGYLA